MNLLVPAALGLASLAGPLVVLYMLRSRRRTVEVSSTMLWEQVGAPVSSAVPWQRLRITPLLILQLLVLAAFVLTLSRPFFTQQALLGPHTVFVIDSSGSMSTAGRLERALARADDLAGEASTANLISVVEAGAIPRVLASFSQSPGPVRDALATITPGGSVADLSGAIRMGRGLATPDRPTSLLLFTDGGASPLPEEPVVGAAHLPFDETGDDVSILALDAVSSDEGLLRVLVTAANHTTVSRTESFELVVAGLPAGSFDLELAAGDEVSHTLAIDASSGDVVEVRRVGPADGNPLDDAAWLVVGEGPARSVTWKGSPSPFLEALVRSLPGWEEEASGDVLVVDGGELPDIDRPAWVIATDQTPPGVEAVELVGNVPVTYQRPGEPILDQIDLSEVAVAEAQVVEAPTWLPIVRAGDAPLILLGEVDGHRVVYFTFDITHSNLPVQVGFPILGARLLAWLAGTGGQAVSTGLAGEPIPISPPGEMTAEVILPDGSSRSIDGSAAVFADTTTPGVYRVRYVGDGDPVEAITAVRNFVPAEAGALAREVGVQPDPGQPPEATSLLREWAPWIIATALLLMAIEWWLGHQRPGLRRKALVSA